MSLIFRYSHSVSQSTKVSEHLGISCLCNVGERIAGIRVGQGESLDGLGGLGCLDGHWSRRIVNSGKWMSRIIRCSYGVVGDSNGSEDALDDGGDRGICVSFDS